MGKKGKPEDGYSLVDPAAMGGIIGGGGYDFQTRYVVCRIVAWADSAGFVQVLHEGTGDVDVHFMAGGVQYRDHVQVKDHCVTPGELREVLESFARIDRAKRGVYRRFALAAPDVSETLHPLVSILARLRGVAAFYRTEPDALATERAEYAARAKTLGLSDLADFIAERVDLDLKLHDYHDDARIRDVFRGGISAPNAQFWRRIAHASDHVYDRMLAEVNARRGRVFTLAEIELLVDELSTTIPGSVQRVAIATIGIHNWAFEKLAPTPSVEVDWSNRFGRDQRRVPAAAEWDAELVPELHRVKNGILREQGSGLVHVLGSCCLSTQIALGLVLRETEGWVIQTTQRPGDEPWYSDAVPTPGYVPLVRESCADPGGEDLALLVSVKNDIEGDVERYLTQANIGVRAMVSVLPPSGAGTSSIISNGDAIAFAVRARDVLRSAQEKHGKRTTHLFMSAPQSVALFLGQRLTAMGRLYLYEFTDPGYVLSCTLNT